MLPTGSHSSSLPSERMQNSCRGLPSGPFSASRLLIDGGRHFSLLSNISRGRNRLASSPASRPSTGANALPSSGASGLDSLLAFKAKTSTPPARIPTTRAPPTTPSHFQIDTTPTYTQIVSIDQVYFRPTISFAIASSPWVAEPRGRNRTCFND